MHRSFLAYSVRFKLSRKACTWHANGQPCVFGSLASNVHGATLPSMSAFSQPCVGIAPALERCAGAPVPPRARCPP
eukprot:4785449-Pleurochrysis_carterae.AAC.2